MINWIVGPQLIGFVFLIAGWVLLTYPPKNINPLYGYRTTASMKNQQTWDEANRFSGRLMIKLGVIFMAFGLLIAAVDQTGVMPRHIMDILRPVFTISSTILMAILVIAITEKHLKNTFNSNNEIH